MSFLIGGIKIIFVLGFLILIHELGHFTVAKMCKIKVKEFSVGFGKELFSVTRKETKYALRLFFLGGYVNLLGENEDIDDENSFGNSSIWKRFLVLIAGAMVNIVFAILLILLIAIIVNKSFKEGMVVTSRIIDLMLESFIKVFSGGASLDNFVGPVGISKIIVQEKTLVNFFFLMGQISFSLGLTNLLPIPGLDGGKILLLIIEAIRKKKMEEEKEIAVTALSMLLLIALAIFITIKDVKTLF